MRDGSPAVESPAVAGAPLRNPVGLVFLVVGLALLAGAAYAYHAAITRPLSWPRADAVVISSRVVNPRKPTEYKPEIVFELNDAGGRRRVTTVASWSSSSYGVVRSYIDGYPAGGRVEVAVNPSAPDDLRYELGPTLTNLLLPGVLGGLGLSFALVGVVTTLKRPRAAAFDGSTPHVAWVSAVLLAIGVGLAGVGAWLWSLGTALDWPEVEATVVDATVIDAPSGSRRRARPAYDIQVTFTYEADGARVTSRTASGDRSRSRAGAEARLAAYAPGSRHRIRRRPDDPNVIRFEVSAIQERIVPAALLLMGAVFGGFGAFMRNRTPGRRRNLET